MAKYPNSDAELTSDKEPYYMALFGSLIANLHKNSFVAAWNFTRNNDLLISVNWIDINFRSYIINCDTGVLRNVHEALTVVLSDQRIFRSVGNINKLIYLDEPNYYHEVLGRAKNLNEIVFDKDRIQLHSRLYILCISFIFLHEAAHLINGHAPYTFAHGAKKFVEGELNNLTPLDMQTLEMDADCCAFMWLLHMLLLPSSKTMLPEFVSKESDIILITQFISEFLFSCYFIKRHKDLNTTKQAPHPNAATRNKFCLDTGERYCEIHRRDLLNIYKKMRQEAIKFRNFAVERNIFSSEDVIRDNEWILSKEAENYQSEILSNWDLWIPRLRNFADKGLAPAST